MENTKADSKEVKTQRKMQEELNKERSISVEKWIEPLPIRQLFKQSMRNRKWFNIIDQGSYSVPAQLHLNKKIFNFKCKSEVLDTNKVRNIQDLFSLHISRFNEVKEKQLNEEMVKHKSFIYRKGMDYIRSSSLMNLYSLLIKIFLNYDIEWKDFILESYELAALIEILLRKNKKISSKM